jgi:biopolymer transport protein ExbB
MNSVFQFIKAGGVMMYPLIACSILLVAIAIERIWTLRKASVDGDALLDAVREEYAKGGASKAEEVCRKAGGCLGRIFSRGLKNAERPPEAIEMALEQEAANEQPMLDANLPIIRTITSISPLLGLLGTIAGMIGSFRVASQAGLSNPAQILGGVSEALVSTASGITLAVIGLVLHNYLANQSKKIIEDVEYYGSELVNFLSDRIE